MNGRSSFGPRLVLLVLFLCASHVHAAFEAFLRLDGIEGEAASEAHRDWMEIGEVKWGVTMQSARAGAPRFSNLIIQKDLDKATPLLFQHCAAGKRIPSGTIELVRADGERLSFFQIDLDDVWVVSVENSGHAGSTESPSEQVQLAFGRISWTLKHYDLAGRPLPDVSAYWDLVKNTGGSSVELPPMLVVEAALTDQGRMRMSWPSVAGREYRIIRSASVLGPFRELTVLTADDSGLTSHSVRIDTASRFFLVEELSQ